MIPQRVFGSTTSFPRGFTLIEVVTALAVVSITLVSLMSLFLSATEKANELGRLLAAAPDESDMYADPSTESRGESAWAWSEASVENVLWQEDGLHGRVRVPPGPVDIQVGWWVDGWRVGVGSVGDATGGDVLLSGLTDVPEQAEVVIRLRTAEGPWGVPWRAVRGGVEPEADEAGATEAGVAGADGDRPVIIVHGATSGISTVAVAPAPSGGSADTPQWPAVVTAMCGRVEVDCDGRTQALQVSPRGLFHLYY